MVLIGVGPGRIHRLTDVQDENLHPALRCSLDDLRFSHNALDGTDELLGIDVALGDARRRVGDIAVSSVKPELGKSHQIEFSRERIVMRHSTTSLWM